MSHRLEICRKIALHRNFPNAGAGHLNVTYMTNFVSSGIRKLEIGGARGRKSKIQKMVSGEENDSEGILSNYESNFLNYIATPSDDCRLTNVRVPSREFAIQKLNKLTSVFYASVLLLIINFVITLSK